MPDPEIDQVELERGRADAEHDHTKSTTLWVLYAFAALSFLAGINSFRTYRLQGFVLGKNTNYYGTHAIIVAVAELIAGFLILALALRSHLKNKRTARNSDR